MSTIFRPNIQSTQYAIPDALEQEVHRKYLGYHTNKDNISTLVFGSSHGQYDFFPIKGEYNLCSSSQDLYYSYQIYRKTANTLHLKNVLLFYSVFSPGFDLEKSSEKLRCVLFNSFWKIPYLHGSCFDFFKAKLYLMFNKSKKITLPPEYKGECFYEWFFPASNDLRHRCAKHLKHNQSNAQHFFLEQMISTAIRQKHRLYVIITPCRSDYKSILPSSQQLFSSLYKIEHCKVLNYFDDDFNDNDFGDTDHLNYQGAIKLSDKIRNEVYN